MRFFDGFGARCFAIQGKLVCPRLRLMAPTQEWRFLMLVLITEVSWGRDAREKELLLFACLGGGCNMKN